MARSLEIRHTAKIGRCARDVITRLAGIALDAAEHLAAEPGWPPRCKPRLLESHVWDPPCSFVFSLTTPSLAPSHP
jgi:hypothetical protein